MDQIPDTSPCAVKSHPFANFAWDPASLIQPEMEPERDWQDILNPMVHDAFGYGATAADGLKTDWAIRGDWGLDGLYRVLAYVIQKRGLQAWCIEMKVESLLEVIDTE
ncbi:hypothetical protein D9758_016549 [Tetrapyrgos nigripes]|uniref:Uncharacterized protein n=1 Tax=Tetrapyrgos nigripes TaxID=182062 RepID=A0A8H5FIZ2_9AGAR|nr:hypothetical protein D9758_016549 [Tetrapyrgos nigripes]